MRELAPVYRSLDPGQPSPPGTPGVAHAGQLPAPETSEPVRRCVEQHQRCLLSPLDVFVGDFATWSTTKSSVFAPPFLYMYGGIRVTRFPPGVARYHEARSDGSDASAAHKTAEKWFLLLLYPSSTFSTGGWRRTIVTPAHQGQTVHPLLFGALLVDASAHEQCCRGQYLVGGKCEGRNERETHLLGNVSREERFAPGRMLHYCTDLGNERGRDRDWCRQSCVFVKAGKRPAATSHPV